MQYLWLYIEIWCGEGWMQRRDEAGSRILNSRLRISVPKGSVVGEMQLVIGGLFWRRSSQKLRNFRPRRHQLNIRVQSIACCWVRKIHGTTTLVGLLLVVVALLSQKTLQYWRRVPNIVHLKRTRQALACDSAVPRAVLRRKLCLVQGETPLEFVAWWLSWEQLFWFPMNLLMMVMVVLRQAYTVAPTFLLLKICAWWAQILLQHRPETVLWTLLTSPVSIKHTPQKSYNLQGFFLKKQKTKKKKDLWPQFQPQRQGFWDRRDYNIRLQLRLHWPHLSAISRNIKYCDKTVAVTVI